MDHPFFAARNIVHLARMARVAGVPTVDPEVLAYHMLEVSRDLKIHHDDGTLSALNAEVNKRMIASAHPDAAYMDDVGRLPDKAPMDSTFRNDSMGQPPQFEELPVTLPAHLASQIGFQNVERTER